MAEMGQSLQKKVRRVNRPRVQIEFDVETNGAIEKVELPFVVGVLADLSGQPKAPLPKLGDRKFVDISPSNFDEVMAKVAPRVAFSVDNTLAGDGSRLGVELEFKSMDDFSPARVAEQVAPLAELLAMRKNLQQILASLPGNAKLQSQLEDVLANTEKRAALAQQLGLDAGAKPEGTPDE